MIKQTFFVLVIFLTCLKPIYSNQTTFEKRNKLSTQDSLVKNNDEQNALKLTESETYRLLYNNAKDTNNRIISTIQWMIGISVAFLLTLFGGHIFFNWRINRKEIDIIKKDIDKKIENLNKDLLKNISEDTKERKKEIKSTIDEKFENKSQWLDMKLEVNK